nr:hypothetical protein [Tanacetum cinerariifolium]
MEVLLAKERILKLIQAWDEKQIKSWSLPELLPQLLNDSRTIDEMLKQHKQYQPEEIQELMCKLLEDVQNISEELAEYINSPNEIIKSSVKKLVPIQTEYEVTFDNESECDVPVCEDSSTFDVIKDHYEILFDSNNDDISSDDDTFEVIEYVEASLLDFELVNLEEKNDVYQEDKEFDLEDIFQIQDVILREKLLNINRLIADIESLNDNLTPDCVLKSSSSFPIFEKSDNSLSYSEYSLPEFETFSDHMEETKSGSTTAHANNSLPEYDSFCFKIEPDQGRLTSVVMKDISDNSINDPLLEEAIYFFLQIIRYHRDDPPFPRPPPKPPDVEVFFDFDPNSRELILAVMNNIDELNEDECFDPGGEINVFEYIEDDDNFPFVI